MVVFRVFLFTILLGGWRAQASDPIVIGEVLRLPSQVLAETRALVISTPLNYALSSDRYPVLYLTDGGEHLLHTRGTVDFLVRNGLMPEVIIVGIVNTDRTRDLTPSRAGSTRADGSSVDLPSSGGASQFLKFLETELFPFIESNFRTAPCRIYLGHSFGGLFGLHALATSPFAFNAVIAASPSLDWDRDRPLTALSKFLHSTKALPRTLFVTMANEEARDPRPTRFDRLRQILGRSKAEGFTWDAKFFPEETHGSVVLLSYFWGLRHVFAGWRLPLEPSTQSFGGTLPDIQRHYQMAGARLGCELAPPEGPLNLAGYQALARGEVGEALSLFRFNAEAHPASPNVHDSLGEAQERAGQNAEALKSYQNAVALGQNGNHPSLPVFQRNLNRVTARLKEAP